MHIAKKCFLSLKNIKHFIFNNIGYNTTENLHYSFGGGRYYSLMNGEGEGYGDDYYYEINRGDGGYCYPPFGISYLFDSSIQDDNQEPQDLILEEKDN